MLEEVGVVLIVLETGKADHWGGRNMAGRQREAERAAEYACDGVIPNRLFLPYRLPALSGFERFVKRYRDATNDDFSFIAILIVA